MVRIAGSDFPNLSKIVNETFDSLGDIYTRHDIVEFDDIEVEADIAMNDDLSDYVLAIDDNLE